MFKIASIIEMSFDVSEDKKKAAEESIELFKKVIANMDTAKTHLDHMYEPFKAAGDIDPEELHNIRGIIARYKDQIKKNFDKVTESAGIALLRFEYFTSDTNIVELFNAFKDQIKKITTEVNILFDILSDLDSPDFKNRYVLSVEAIRSEAAELEKIINERIIDFIDTNILAKDWMTDIKSQFSGKYEEKVPYITKLYEERQKALEGQ